MDGLIFIVLDEGTLDSAWSDDGVAVDRCRYLMEKNGDLRPPTMWEIDLDEAPTRTRPRRVEYTKE